jgi:hypothetical protein
MAEVISTVCSACQAPVFFLPNASSGRRQIVDQKMSKALVVTRAQGETPIARTHDEVREAIFSGQAAVEVLTVLTDHHATCPEAERFRRGRASSEGGR